MADVFISYAREDASFVRRLHGELGDRGRKSWVDFEGIPPSAEWFAEIRAAIEVADCFLFVLTPASVASRVCGQELEHAIHQNKKLVPILRAEAATGEIPEAVARLNWIYFRDDDPFDPAVENLMRALDTDLEWVREHTALLRKAGDWDRAGSDPSLMLRGSELKRFEDWIARAPDRDPKPTGLQSRYVLASRRTAFRRQRFIWLAVTVGLAIAIVLSIATWFQSRERWRQTEIATARQLINRSEGLRERQPDGQSHRYREQSTVAAVRALSSFSQLGLASLDADRAVRRSMALLPRPLWQEEAPVGSIEVASFDPSGRYLSIVQRSLITVWDVVERTSAACEWSPGGAMASSRAVAIEPSGSVLALATYNGTRDDEFSAVTVLDLADCSRRVKLRLPGRRERLRFGAGGRALALLGNGRDSGPVWGAASGAELALGLEVIEIYELAFHPREELLAVLFKGADRAEVRILDMSTSFAQPLAEWRPPERTRKLRWSGDGTTLLTAGYTADIRVHDPETGKRLATIDYPWKALVTGPISDFVGVVGESRATVLEASSGLRMTEVPHRGRIEAMALSPPGNEMLVVLGESGAITAWGLTGSRWLAEIRVTGPVEGLGFDPESTLLLAAAEGRVGHWELPASGDVRGPVAHSSFQTATLPTDPLVARVEGRAVGRGEQRVVIFDPVNGAEVVELEFRRRVLGAAVSPDGRRLALSVGKITRGGWEFEYQIRDRASRDTLASLDVKRSLENRLAGLLVFSPDGRFLATGSPDGIAVRKVVSLEKAYDLFHPDAESVFFRQSGDRVATVSQQGEIRVWDLGDSAVEIARLEDRDDLAHLAMSPNGRWLATAVGSEVRLWALAADDLIVQACARVGLDCP